MPDFAPIATLQADLAPEIARLPRLSLVVDRFLRDAARDTARAADFAAALDLDPPLRDWVLRQVNSGFYGLSRPVVDVAHACVVLGLGPLTRLVYAACTRDLLGRRLACYRYPGHGFWLHGMAVGLAAADLAGRAPGAGLLPAEALVAGLLHDTGKLLLDARLLRAGGPRHVTVAEERRVTGVDHAALSGAVAEAWDMPAHIVRAVAGHHDADPVPEACIIRLADLLARHWGLGVWTYARLDLEPPLRDIEPVAAPLGLRDGALADWAGGLVAVMAGVEELVRAIGHGGPPRAVDASPVSGADRSAPTPTSSRRRRQRLASRDRGRRRSRR
jgi:HD-like signal output (HDOD) protein